MRCCQSQAAHLGLGTVELPTSELSYLHLIQNSRAVSVLAESDHWGILAFLLAKFSQSHLQPEDFIIVGIC